MEIPIHRITNPRADGTENGNHIGRGMSIMLGRANRNQEFDRKAGPEETTEPGFQF